jgi:hypothetical protein
MYWPTSGVHAYARKRGLNVFTNCFILPRSLFPRCSTSPLSKSLLFNDNESWVYWKAGVCQTYSLRYIVDSALLGMPGNHAWRSVTYSISARILI